MHKILRMERFRPSCTMSSALCIRFFELIEFGLEYLVIDLDGTLCAKEQITILRSFKEVIDCARRMGLKDICVVSNVVYPNQKRLLRLRKVAREINAHSVAAYWPYLKPHPKPFLKALKKMGARPSNTMVIGDQLFTDILGGNRLGMYTILMPSLPGSDHLATLPKRLIETWLVKKLDIQFPTQAAPP